MDDAKPGGRDWMFMLVMAWFLSWVRFSDRHKTIVIESNLGSWRFKYGTDMMVDGPLTWLWYIQWLVHRDSRRLKVAGVTACLNMEITFCTV